MKLKRNRFFLWIFIFFGFFVYCKTNAVLRIAIDIPQSLSKSFANVRKYIVNGYSAQHILGINHLIIDAIKLENKRRIAKKERPISNKFALQEYNLIYLTFMYVDEPYEKKRINVIKKALKEAVNEYLRIVSRTKFNFKVEKSALFVSRELNRLEIAQNVIVNTGFASLKKLEDLIKASFFKYKIKFSTLGLGVHAGYAKIKSPDQDFILLLKHNKKILQHLRSVKPPKGAAEGFNTESKIHLYSGLKRLASYDL